jgi:hypothetical protein
VNARLERPVEKPEGSCTYGLCTKKAIDLGRCGRHHRFVANTTRNYGGESREMLQRIPFGSDLDDPRDRLITSLAAAVGDARALAVVDALDDYLKTDPVDRAPAFQWSPPNLHAALDQVTRERDEALALAKTIEREEETRAPALDTESPPPPPEPVVSDLATAARSLRAAAETLAGVALSRFVATVVGFAT